MGLLRTRPLYFVSLAAVGLGLAALALVAAGSPEVADGTAGDPVPAACSPCVIRTSAALSEWPALPRPGGAWEQVEHVVPRERFDAMEPWQQSVMAQIAVHAYRTWQSGNMHLRTSLCFEPGSDTNVMASWTSANDGPGDPSAFYTSSSWSSTATDGGAAGADGIAVTLTFSFVPDGTVIPSGGPGDTGGGLTSNLIAFLDGIYGTSASIPTRPWFPFFQGAADSIFDTWSTLTGIRYVFEANDDGGAFPQASVTGGLAGAVGVRGDLRISGRNIDGQPAAGNILAFNYFPNVGDMVIDTANVTFYSNTTNNSRSLRNVLAHEHGHGIGLGHVCSLNANFLMEPIINTTFDLAQEDDIRGANRLYGDRWEFAEGNSDSFGNPVTVAAFNDPDGLGPLGQFIDQDDLSIDRSADQDFWSFSSVAPGYQLSINVTPTGTTYNDDPQTLPSPGGPTHDGIGCPLVSSVSTNALQQSDLSWTLFASDQSTVIASSNSGGLGAPEVVNNIPVPGTGPWYLRVDGVQNATQMYDLRVDAELIAVEPVITCPANVAQECSGAGGNPLSLNFPVTDANPLAVNVTWTVNGTPQGGTANLPVGGGIAVLNHTFPVGVNTVVATATNTPAGLTDTCTMTVTITDTAPPVITTAIARSLLWPARNGMMLPGFSASALDVCDPNPTVTVDVFSDEPNGAAPFSPDATGTTAGDLRLRMERAYPGGNGRVYLVRVTATDASGNSAVACLTAQVPVMPAGMWILMVRAEAMGAEATCNTTGNAPAGWSLLHSFTLP